MKLVLTLTAAAAAIATGLAAPAQADPAAFSGTYVGGDDEGYWTVATSCPTDGCTGSVSSNEGWSVPTTRVNGVWHFIITKPDGAICADGSYAPAYIELAVNATTLQGTISLDDNYSCPGGTVTTTPFSLTKVG